MTNSQKIITQLKSKYGTAVSGQYEAIRFQYYDYVRLPATGTNRLTFFSNPIGAVDPNITGGTGKTLEETNIRRSGELDERFAIMQVRTTIDVLPVKRQPAAIKNLAAGNVATQALTSTYQALRNLNFQGVLSVNFGQKNFIQIEQPFQTCPPGYGPSIRSISANATAGTFPPISQYATQSVDPRDVYVMDPAIFVEKGQTFGATIDFYLNNSVTLPVVTGTDRASVNIGVILDGYVIRPVQ
jgi:hypothetical protein